MRSYLNLIVLLALLAGAISRAQQAGTSDAEKRRLFLKAREEMRTVPATPSLDATPRPRPKPRPVATPIPEPTPRPRPKPDPEATPRPRPKPEPEATPRPQPKPEPEVTPRPRTPTVKRTTPVEMEPRAAVTIEKRESGDFEPAPSVGWFERWNYLTRSVRAAIDRAKVRKGRWRYIVVHNSGTRQGNARAFDYYHRRVRGMENGMAYHFVIGNGTSSGDGQIEIGSRWTRQIHGGHVHSDYLNNIALGICLVGDFNRQKPTDRQLDSLVELVRYLRKRVGRIDRKWSIVKAHRDINPPRWPTDCPGDRFPYRWLKAKFE